MQLKALTTFQIFFSLKAYPVELGQQGWVQKEKKGLEQESSSCHWHSQPATDTEACLGRFYPGADLPTSGRIFSRKLTPLIGFILVCVRCASWRGPPLVSRKLGLTTSRNCAPAQLWPGALVLVQTKTGKSNTLTLRFSLTDQSLNV